MAAIDLVAFIERRVDDEAKLRATSAPDGTGNKLDELTLSESRAGTEVDAETAAGHRQAENDVVGRVAAAANELPCTAVPGEAALLSGGTGAGSQGVEFPLGVAEMLSAGSVFEGDIMIPGMHSSEDDSCAL